MASTYVTCYLWPEVDAKRGFCEIGTCLYLQLMPLPNTKTHAIFYSDACSVQNRNQFIASCLLHVVAKKYTSRQAISAAKKKDLVGLCKNGIIPSEYHEYYKFLPANNSVIDTTVDTDVEEEKIDSDQD